MKLKYVLSLLAVAVGSVGLLTFAIVGADASNDEVIRELLKWSIFLLVVPGVLSLSVWSFYRAKKRWTARNEDWGKYAKELKLDFHPGTGLNWLLPGLGTPVGMSGTRNGVALHMTAGESGGSKGNTGSERTRITVEVPHLPDGMWFMVGKPVWGSDKMKISTGDATFDARYHVNSAHAQFAGKMVDHRFRTNFASLSALRSNVKISGYKGVKGAKDELSLVWDGCEEDAQVLELAIETISHLVRKP